MREQMARQSKTSPVFYRVLDMMFGERQTRRGGKEATHNPHPKPKRMDAKTVDSLFRRIHIVAYMPYLAVYIR